MKIEFNIKFPRVLDRVNAKALADDSGNLSDIAVEKKKSGNKGDVRWAGKSERRRRRENPNGTLITGGARFLNCGRLGTSLQFLRD